MKKIVVVVFAIGLNFSGFSQDLSSILEQETANKTTIVTATFKGPRLLNGHSIETRKKGIFEFLISHRFGRINSGAYNLFGLDQSNIRFGFEYALFDNLTVAFGRSSFEKTYDGYLKYRLIKQKTGKNSFPFSVTFFGSATEKTLKDYAPNNKPTFTNRLTYTSQFLIAIKINSNLSFQFSPTYIHFNTVRKIEDSNDIFSLGFGGRMKISKRISINGEYYYNLDPFKSINSQNSLGLGIDIETGGHVFQLIVTNSRAMIEKGFITETTGNFFKGDIHFGFNVSRAF
ncbi:hypothetical protein Lupro_11680 [Lutibacter profundi]|uniref:DUF5777 domain-containing protein n=1 Tax=Lutibacter profundi TaxID=1622118 RepID=A0A0X8G8B0_9FLAO|nr:DUF5777 family beta-barrel protein [Lutibacter profundi]AMC11885.1 hypothetical protein Lupro_11680 [Lutibacter profundi]